MTPMRAMVIDDSRAMRMILKRIVTKLNFEAVEAGDGKEAMDLLADMTEVPELALIDWNMPNMTGIECLQALRSSGSAVPFGFVTSEGSPEMREKAAGAGALFLIAKPFTEDTFKEHLDGVIA